MNSIQDDQNSEGIILSLKAQRYSYTKAKMMHKVEFINAMVSVIICALFIIVIKVPNEIKTLVSSGILIISIYSSRKEKDYTSTGANIQEIIDCELFKMEWNNILCGVKTDLSEIIELSRKYKGDSVSNWYSGEISGSIDHNIAVLLCQYTNVSWDNQLRKKYVRFVLIQSICLIIFFVILLLYKNDTFYNSMFSMLPVIACIKYTYSTIKNNQDLLKEKKRLQKIINDLFEGIKRSVVIENSTLRGIQDSIYILRKNQSKISDWFHFISKPNIEPQIDEALRLLEKQIGV